MNQTYDTINEIFYDDMAVVEAEEYDELHPNGVQDYGRFGPAAALIRAMEADNDEARYADEE